MVVLIDTNLVLDVLQNRKPFVHDSAFIFKLCESGRLKGSLCSLAFADTVYVMRKYLDPDSTYDLLSKLSLIFTFRDYSTADMAKAVMLNWDDYEDAVQSVVAKRIRADYIITRNTKDFVLSQVPAITPDAFIKKHFS